MPRTVSSIEPQFAIACYKGGRKRILAKVVVAWPTGETVLAMPYRNRRLATPSLPPQALAVALRAGATAWVVRLDQERRCYRLPLEKVSELGEYREDGEVYVPLRHFECSLWLEWSYVTTTVVVDRTPIDYGHGVQLALAERHWHVEPPGARQLAMFAEQ